jgi:ubiquinone/menaquinone biosynthesis C-methylase UbiE
VREITDQPRDIEGARSNLRTAWEAVAPRWRVPDMAVDPHPIHHRLLEIADVRAGERALDLACGTGSTALMRRLAPAGTLLGLDISPSMVDIARQWADRQQLPWAAFRTIAGEADLGVPPMSFDVATCMFGLMFMPEPVAALRGLYEALIPGGRVAVCTWSAPERNPFLGVPLAVARRHVDHPMLDPASPSPLAIPSTGELAALLAAAGFADTRVSVMDRPADTVSPEQAWQSMIASGWPLAFLPPQPETTWQALHDDMIATLHEMFPDGNVRLAGEANLAVAVRPE